MNLKEYACPSANKTCEQDAGTEQFGDQICCWDPLLEVPAGVCPNKIPIFINPELKGYNSTYINTTRTGLNKFGQTCWSLGGVRRVVA